MNGQKKSIEIGDILIVQKGKELFLYNKYGEGMGLSSKGKKALEDVLEQFFKDHF